ncbi:trypsin-like peptidase domain-containing protein [Streptomyces sp. NPDC101110]|uniref:trypsin-like peptidase domain-containing protein n=1 Tax=unclassified Streptomyces TaxID=2593676 RepID=UPI0037F87D89
MASRNRSRETGGSAQDSPDRPGRAGQQGTAAPGLGTAGQESRAVLDDPGKAGQESRAALDDRGTAWSGAGAVPGDCLVRIQDLAGRPRGTGFLADHHGTLITSHEAVDGLSRLVLCGAGDCRLVVAADAVTPLPALDLALVRTEGLGVPPLPVTVRDGAVTGAYVRIAAGGWREARVLGPACVTYAATDRLHRLDDALELAVGTAGRDALRPGGGAAGGPVLDAVTGAVVGVLGTALSSGHRDVGFAVPLRARVAGTAGPLAGLLAENAATVPAYGADLNLAGVLELTGTSRGPDGPPGRTDVPEPVERAGVAAEFDAFAAGEAAVLGLVGAPGSGRTTELAALAERRGRSGHPTLRLRGCDLRDDDKSVADAVRRALTRAAPVVAAARATAPHSPLTPLSPSSTAGPGDMTPERLARLAGSLGRPLLLLLDGPEEMPPAVARRLSDWTDETVRWLGETGARLVVACRPEYWEEVSGLLHRPRCVVLGDLTEDEAREARLRYGIAEGALGDADARHPLTLRLLGEIRDEFTDPAETPMPPTGPVDRDQVFSAYLDLMALRVATRLAAGNGLRGTAVRRLAAKAAGQVHEAARRGLCPGPGDLDREAFAAVFPWGTAPQRLGGCTGWASAVLAEGLLVPAGPGYRFAHDGLADWLQGMHLDLDEALHALVHCGADTPSDPVPHHRIGPVVQALLYLGRQHGAGPLASRLADLVHALDADPGSWWAARLLAGTLSALPDAAPYTEVLRLLADRIVAWRRQERPLPEEIGPSFWTAVRLPLDTRCALLRRLVHADGPPCAAGPRFLDAVAELLAADPTAVQPQLVRWFDDEEPLPATPDATVATAAQVLLHTHRHRALDELTDVLVDRAHPRADELLAVLAEEEPSAMCRAADRWARDERPARRSAAAAHALRVAPHAGTAGDRALLRYAALTLLARPTDRALHGGALALLVQDPHTRARYLARALEHFAAGDPRFAPDALAGALLSDPEPVLGAFAARLERPDAEEALRALADAAPPGLARRIAALLCRAARGRPELAGEVAAYADQRLDRGPAARPALLPLVTGLLEDGDVRLRCALAAVLTPPGIPASRPLRRELRDALLAREHDTDVLDALLHAAARNGGDDLRDLVHRIGLLLVRTPQGATRFDRALVDLGRHVPGFAARVAAWLADAPGDWAALVGPSSHRTIENLAGAGVPV